MLKKNYFSRSLIISIFLFLSLFLVFYQFYIVKKLLKELQNLQEARQYYINFLNSVTDYLKKKTLN